MNNPAPGSRIRQSGRSTGAWRDVGRCRGLLGSAVWLAASRGRLWTGTAISGLTGGVGCAGPFSKGPNPPGSSRLLWATRRRFDPSSSPSASSPKAMFSLGELVGN